MRWGLSKRQSAPSQRFVVAAALAAVGFSSAALADVFRLQPYLIAEQIFTDNVEVSATDQDADGVTLLTARVDGLLETSRINAAFRADLFYSEFWASDEFDSINGLGTGAIRIEALKDTLFLEGVAQRREVLLNSQAESASGLFVSQDQILQTNYGVGPYITFDIFDIADLAVRASYSQISFDDPVVGPALVPLRDVTAKHVAGSLTTGDRHTLYELAGSGEYLETDTGFEQRNAIGSVFLHVTNMISAIGRIGYERIDDPSFPSIKGTIWSAGARYRVGEETQFRVEYGKRFGGTTWLGEAAIPISPRVMLIGQYTDVLRPPQLSLIRSIEDLFDEEGNIDLISAQAPDLPDPAIIDEIVRDKNFEVRAVYGTELQTVTLSGRRTNRTFPVAGSSDETFAVDFSILEKLSRQLTYTANLGFEDNSETIATNTTSKAYLANLEIVYVYNESVQFAGGYGFRLETTPGSSDTVENVLRVSVEQAF